MKNAKIIVVGTGSWGTALAVSMHNAAKSVSLWGRRKEHVEEMLKTRKCAYLPNLALPDDLNITNDVEAISGADVILWVAPVQKSEALLKTLKPFIASKTRIVNCSKGLEINFQKPLTNVFENILPNSVGVLSGPNFADEFAKGLPAASTVAFKHLDTASEVAQILRHSAFRVYAYDDVFGVEMAAALKNVMAIAAGIVMGKKLGNNCLAALITRANAEIGRMLVAMGGSPKTNQTLAGIGDLILTCSSGKSRNASLGIALAEGRNLQEILLERVNVTEGVATAKVAYELAQKQNVYAPIIGAVYNVLHGGQSLEMVVNSMLNTQQELEI